MKVIGLGYKLLSIPSEISGSKPLYLVIIRTFCADNVNLTNEVEFGF